MEQEPGQVLYVAGALAHGGHIRLGQQVLGANTGCPNRLTEFDTTQKTAAG